VLVALAVVTASALAFQVVLTRMLSSVLAYHFSFLAISLALLGTGGGSLLVYVRPAWFDRSSLESVLARLALIYGILLILTPLALVRLDYDMSGGVDVAFSTNLALACALAAAPSFAVGALVAMAIRGFPDHVGRVYAWDLVGAGVGALAIVPLLRFPAPDLLVALGVAACVAALLFTRSDRQLRLRSLAAAALGVLVLVGSAAGSLLYLPMNAGDRDDLAADVWHPLSRVQGVELPDNPDSVLFYDRVFAPVPNVTGNDLPTWEDLHLGPSSIGYELTGPGHALVIGGGGGRDIYNALTSRQTVDVIELNSAIRHVVDDVLGDVSGSPYSREGVSTAIGDGRAILAGRDVKYDQIHIGFTDTLSANAAQGFALTENNLYTIEAFEEYLDHLAPRGILNVSRLERLVGDEAIRVTVLTLAALERYGVDHPERHVVVIRGTDSMGVATAPYGTVLARLEPFTPAELDTIRRLADERGDGVVFAPGGPYEGAWADLASAPSWQAFCRDYPLNVCPPTDDKPFFFNMRRPADVFDSQSGYHYGLDPYQLLLLTLGILVVLSIVALVAPLRLARPVERPRMSGLLYFGAIGLGFLMLEIVLIQRFVLFLGFPTYALSVVLFALLTFTGVGSAVSSRLGPSRRTLTCVLVAVVALVLIASLNLQTVLRELIDLPFPARVAITVLLLAPIGVALGMPMPLGLARFRSLYPGSVAYAWGVNGVASVLASVAGVALAITFGYVVASLAAAACYAFALLHAALGRWAPTNGGTTAVPSGAAAESEATGVAAAGSRR
jgi:hypothetical protein